MRQPGRFGFACSLLALALCASCAVEGEAELVSPEDFAAEEARAADNVELKVTVQSAQVAAALRSLGLRDGRAERRDVYFYDTPSLELFEAGTVLRARKVYDGADDSTVKLRPMLRAAVASPWFSESGFKCETDVVGERSTDSCSLTEGQDRGEIDSVANASRTVRQLFTDDQERYLETYAPRAIPWTRLRALGPIDARVWHFTASSVGTTVTAERWTLPDATVLLELSIRVPRTQQRTMQTRFDRWLRSVRIDPSEQQETKTRVALEFFAARAR